MCVCVFAEHERILSKHANKRSHSYFRLLSVIEARGKIAVWQPYKRLHQNQRGNRMEEEM